MNFKLKNSQIKLAVIMSLSVWQPLVLAQSSVISDTPLPVTSAVAPNILFSVDPALSANNKDAVKTVVNGLSDIVRTGLVKYAAAGGAELVIELDTNNAAHKTSMSSAIDALTGTGTTSLARTLSRMARYLTKNTAGSDATLTLHPGVSGVASPYTDLNQSTATASTIFSESLTGVAPTAPPIQYYCQKSFAVVLAATRPTEDQTISSKLCNYLGIGSSGACNSNTDQGKNNTLSNGTGADLGYHVNSGSGKRQLHFGSTHTYDTNGSDFLDDVAAAAYDMDLRPDLTATTGTKKNNLVTYTVALDALQSVNDPLMQEAAAAGGGLYRASGDTSTSSLTLISALEAATNDVLGKDGSAAAVAVANAHVTNTDNAAYTTNYNSGTWSGDLVAYPINTSTGVPDINSPIWTSGCPVSGPQATDLVDPTDATKGVLGCSAQVQLDTKAPGDRFIFTSVVTPNSGTHCFNNCGQEFSTAASTLSDAQYTRLRINTTSGTATSPTAIAEGQRVVSYLRGDRSEETSATMRLRAHLLGDTVNAEPLVIRRPEKNYSDTGYATYKQNKSGRTQLILQAANDGMVHAFNEQTGAEEWAYIPDMLISNSNDPADTTMSLLGTRTRRNGFNHYFMLDATPVSGDVDFNNTYGSLDTTNPQWRTIAVGGMGKGGRGYYALDVSATVATTQADAAAKSLWEFPASVNDTDRAGVTRNMGYSFAKPIIVKTRAYGWVVLVSSGYNNGTNAGDSGGDGLGHLYVLSAKTGDLIKDFTTAGCHATPLTNPCGLSSINAYIEQKDVDNTVDIAYGGDLYGNLWRFDLRGTTGITGGTAADPNWAPSKVAVLKDASGAVQPITTTPELSKTAAGEYMIYVGTGQYLGKPDLPCPPTGCTSWTPNSQSTQTQTMYGLKEARTAATTVESIATLADPLRTVLQQQTYTTSGSTRLFSTTAVAAAKKGWYVDFTGGERLVTDPAVASGTLVFTSNIPSTQTCIPGGSSWLYAVNYETGGNVITTAGASSWSGTSLGNGLASRPVLIQLPGGAIKAIIRLSDTTTLTKDVPTSATATEQRRVSWRELIDK